MGVLITFVLATFFVICIMKFVFHVTISVIGFLINSLIGAVVIGVLNIFGLDIAINWLTASIVGIFGVPGVLLVLVLKYIFHVV